MAHRQRRVRNGYNAAKHLYIAKTACGLKVGASVKPQRRMPELKRTMLAHTECDLELIKAYELKGHFEPFVHHELASHRVQLPNVRLSTEIFSCDLETITAALDRAIAQDLLG